jgi:RNA polymerase sigma-70 factor (ECF subfamily)
MSVDPDLADVEAVLAGEVDRFAGIVERWQGPLVNLAFRFVRDAARAEDLAQDVFVLAFRRLAHWRREARFGTWLYSVALNRCRSDLRRRSERLAPLPAELPAQAAPRDDVLAADLHDAVRRELLALPDLYREALTLFYLEEQDLAAAAAALRVPQGTLKARLHRGRELLRRRLERLLGGPPR